MRRVFLRVSTVGAFCTALLGGGAAGAGAEITAPVPAGVRWRAFPRGMMPMRGPTGSGREPGSQVSRSRLHCPGSKSWVRSL